MVAFVTNSTSTTPEWPLVGGGTSPERRLNHCSLLEGPETRAAGPSIEAPSHHQDQSKTSLMRGETLPDRRLNSCLPPRRPREKSSTVGQAASSASMLILDFHLSHKAKKLQAVLALDIRDFFVKEENVIDLARVTKKSSFFFWPIVGVWFWFSLFRPCFTAGPGQLLRANCYNGCRLAEIDRIFLIFLFIFYCLNQHGGGKCGEC